ncbi:phage portal protein [Ruegeria jejuensis]|uniref:phage portal protein n=1 Tax=Ruegeria jejuensis TaxID=3233338 RepID=UPI00355B3C75
MGFFNWFRPKEPASQPQAAYTGPTYDVGRIDNPAELEEFLRGGNVTLSGKVISREASMKVAAVYRCTTLLAGVVSGLPVEVKDLGNTRDEAHQVSRLLNRKANRWQHGRQFRKQLEFARLMYGNGYALKVRTGNRITSLLPMLPHAVTCEQMPDGSLDYTYRDRFGREFKLTQEEVFHVRGPCFDGVTGQSVLGFARETVGFSLAVQSHGTNLFERGTNIRGAFTHPAKLSPEAFERLKESMDKFNGVDGDRAFQTIITEEGMTYQQMGMTSTDAEFVENKKLGITEVCMFFGVPPHKAGFTENQTSYGQGVEHQNIGFIDDTVSPILDEWEGAIERDLMPNELSKRCEINTYKLQRGDQDTRWKANRIKLEMGTHSPNEIRRLEGEPERPGGDVYYDPPGVPQKGEGDVVEDTAGNQGV